MSVRDREGIRMLNEWYAVRTEDEDWFGGFCSRIADGESYWEIAREYEVKASVLRNWIATDPKREEEFQAALKNRAETKTERVEAETYKLAMTDVVISESSKMKAISMLRDQKTGITISQNGVPGKITVTFVDSVDGKPT